MFSGFFCKSSELFGGGAMLVDFEVENFRSYREAKRFSMVASSAKELPQNLIDTDLGLNLVRARRSTGRTRRARAIYCSR